MMRGLHGCIHGRAWRRPCCVRQHGGVSRIVRASLQPAASGGVGSVTFGDGVEESVVVRDCTGWGTGTGAGAGVLAGAIR